MTIFFALSWVLSGQLAEGAPTRHFMALMTVVFLAVLILSLATA